MRTMLNLCCKLGDNRKKEFTGKNIEQTHHILVNEWENVRRESGCIRPGRKAVRFGFYHGMISPW